MSDPVLEARYHALNHAHAQVSARARSLEMALRRLLRAFDRMSDFTDQVDACEGTAPTRANLCPDCASEMERESLAFCQALERARQLVGRESSTGGTG